MGRPFKVRTAEPTTDELIEQIQRNSGIAPEPGDLTASAVLHRGDEEMPAPMMVSDLQSAGYTTIYDTRTGAPSITNRNMLLAQLGKRREDGSLAFSVTKPNISPVQGIHKCLLHPDELLRAEYDSMGLSTCTKGNLTSPYQVTQHMKHRHPAEWATIEEGKARAEREADRAFQRHVMGVAGKTA